MKQREALYQIDCEMNVAGFVYEAKDPSTRQMVSLMHYPSYPPESRIHKSYPKVLYALENYRVILYHYTRYNKTIEKNLYSVTKCVAKWNVAQRGLSARCDELH